MFIVCTTVSKLNMDNTIIIALMIIVIISIILRPIGIG